MAMMLDGNAKLDIDGTRRQGMLCVPLQRIWTARRLPRHVAPARCNVRAFRPLCHSIVAALPSHSCFWSVHHLLAPAQATTLNWRRGRRFRACCKRTVGPIGGTERGAATNNRLCLGVGRPTRRGGRSLAKFLARSSFSSLADPEAASGLATGRAEGRGCRWHFPGPRGLDPQAGALQEPRSESRCAHHDSGCY